jgi:peroxiredoxin
VGFPTLKKLTEKFNEIDDVLFVGIQTVFEGYSTNTKDKLRKNQLKYDLKIPMAHAAGNHQTHDIPAIMRNYRSGGTPWTVIIDPSGKVVYNNFHIEVKPAVALIKKLLS